MAKKLDTKSLIHTELKKLQQKINEFQHYLEINNIITEVTTDGSVLLSEDDQNKLHKEILVQIKMQDALFVWMPLLEKLKAGEQQKQLETRGDIEINGLFKNKTE